MRIMDTRIILLAAGCFLSASVLAQKKYTVTAPDKSLSVQVTVSDSIYYQLLQDGKTLAEASAISFTTDQNAPGWKVSKAWCRQVFLRQWEDRLRTAWDPDADRVSGNAVPA